MKDRPTVLDLFCGAGGMSLGFEQAGFDVVAGVEIDPVHASVHSYNFPECKVYREDITTLTGKQIIKDNGQIDVIIGGPPCQGFSLIGKRDMGDDRNKLVMEFMRMVAEIQPSYFVMENVAGLTVGNAKQFLDEAITYIEARGYEVVKPVKVLNAVDYGVPQNRRRLFLYGYKRGLTPPTYPDKIEKRVTVEEAIGDLPDIDLFEELLENDTLEYTLNPASQYAYLLHNPEENTEDYSTPRQWDKDKITSETRTIHTDKSKERFHNTRHGDTEKISRFLKLDPKGQCNTLRAGTDKSRGAYTSPRPINPYFDRCISVREALRLHSYPDWFRMHKTKWHGFREVGNSVPPLLAKSVAGQVIKAMNIEPKKPTRIVPLGDEYLLELSVEQAVKGEQMAKKSSEGIYVKLIKQMFLDNYKEGDTEVPFQREHLVTASKELGIPVPKNLGDVVYSFRYRNEMPEVITSTAPEGKEWLIVGTGKATYSFKLSNISNIIPNKNLEIIPIPDNTPEAISMYQLSDEQSLLCKIRYNRLLDVFLGIVTYSMQNHLRTQVKGIGQIEIDEIYIGVNKKGQHFIIPVEAKVGKDMIGAVQTMQDIKCCQEKFPDLICIPIAVHKMEEENALCMFRLKMDGEEVRIEDEKHYRLLLSKDIDPQDIANRNRDLTGI